MTDYSRMNIDDLLGYCGTDTARWTEAYRQHTRLEPADQQAVQVWVEILGTFNNA